ncbi:MAG: hypothetical protein BGO42_04370 [Flavobacterium sp. 40-81]|nr:MAG: hypothetical protein BGO42_04370 [Flavobacterium sp. 40-81]
MQNGSLGEARAKAFLMDRFWILERSVDIEGADLIIQRRLTNRNLLDTTPPKLGFVQVKFFESDKTTQYIPTVYITDSEGKLREDFFILFHTGFEENSKIYFLTSDVVNSDFEIVEVDGMKKYRIYGTKILNSEKYLVKSKSNTLNRIENNLVFADFKKNREFISWKLPNVVSDTSAILPYYKENLENHWGNIPDEFQRIKNYALKSMYELEEIYLKLKEIVDDFDPIEAFAKIEDLKSEIGSNYMGRWGTNMFDNLYDEDFYYTCMSHKEKIEALTNDGLLDDYINSKSAIADSLVSYLSNYFPINSSMIHTMQITFSLKDFSIENITHDLINASEYFNIPFVKNDSGSLKIDIQYYDGIKNISENKFEYYWLAGRIHIDDKYKDNLPDFYRSKIERVYRDCTEKMYELKYHD